MFNKETNVIIPKVDSSEFYDKQKGFKNSPLLPLKSRKKKIPLKKSNTLLNIRKLKCPKISFEKTLH